MIEANSATSAQGLLVRNVNDMDLARLDFYAGSYRVDKRDQWVTTDAGADLATCYFPDNALWAPGRPWLLIDWVDRWGSAAVATAEDVMALYGQADAADIARRRGAMMVRGASRVRAMQPAVATVRRVMEMGDVAVQTRHYPYSKFFSVEEYDLSFRRFDGTMSPVVNRATFVTGDAVTVLPYDPVRDRVLLIEQFRAGPYARGDANPWQLEAIAGRIDPGETPEDAARREAKEEAGLVLGALLPVAQYYPSTGAKTEYLYSYVATVDLPDGVAGLFGMDDESEDIRGHLASFDAMMQMVASGEIANAPLILTALWLQRDRGRLRRE